MCAVRLGSLGFCPALGGVLLAFCNILAAAAPWAPQATDSAEQNAYSQAEALVRNHEWDAGLQLLDPLREQDPNNLKVLNLTALALTGKGQIGEADRYFERALRLDPNFLPALRNLGINEFNAGRFESADRHFSAALKAAPDDPVINLFAGRLAYRTGRFTQAAAALPKAEPFLSRDANLSAMLAISYLAIGETQNALSLLPSIPAAQLSADSQLSLGAKLAERRLNEEAVPYLIAARASDAESYNASFDLAICYINLKRYSDAASVLEETSSRGRDTSEVENLLAEAYEGNHEAQNAVNALRRAIAIDPDNIDNYLDFASLCIDHQDYPAALKVLEVGLQVHPDSDRLFFERAILYAVQDNFKHAEEDFKKASALSPDKDSSYKGLSVLYLESGNAAKAEATLEQRLKVKPNDPELLYLLGEALLRSGAQRGDDSYRKAESALERSVKLDPNACLPHVALGKMYLEQDRVADAILELEKARAIDPKEKSTYWQLANAYRKMGDSEKQKLALMTLKKLNDQDRLDSRSGNSQVEESGKLPQTTEN